MCDNLNSNPFAGLFTTINDAVSFSSQDQPIINDSSNVNHIKQAAENSICDNQNSVNFETSEVLENNIEVKLLEEAFGITLKWNNDSKLPSNLVFIDTDSVEHAIFERLMLPDPESKLTLNKSTAPKVSHATEKKIVPYLFKSYSHLQKYREKVNLSNTISNLCQIILRNISTALQEPELFQGQEVYNQLYHIIVNEEVSVVNSFINGIITEIKATNEDSNDDVISVSFNPILDIIYKEAEGSTLLFLNQNWFSCLLLFSTIEPLAKLIIYHSTPKVVQGKAYGETLLGVLLRISCLPKTAIGPFEFFDKPHQQHNDTGIEGSIWRMLNDLTESLYKVFHSLLKCSSEVRHLTLEWIGNCLHTNASRGQIWNYHNDNELNTILCTSDGFMVNLGNVLLRLCQPFCVGSNSNLDKVPKIDPTYCAAEAKDEEESRARGLHLKGMTTVTCLIPNSEGKTRPIAKSFGFITECFFLTHRALDLGYRVVLDKFLRTNQSLARIQRVYNDARTGGSSEVLDMIRQKMEEEMTKYLSLRASLLSPSLLNLLTKFHATTAFWLMQVNANVIKDEDREQMDYAPKQAKMITFPLSEIAPTTWRCIPEFVVDNTIGFVCLLRRLSPHTFEEQGSSFLNPILTEIIVLMESQQRLYNPHLRARLAEGLEALLPTTDENHSPGLPDLGTFHRQQLFIYHPCRHKIVVNLLQVFVCIEMTGQSVQFEQKFNYRRPMYVVMDYLWKIPEYRENFVTLAQEAESNMEAVQPPLFLRFINLLMNDAVFLLDEAFSNMAQLKMMLLARENGEWNKLPPHERDQQTEALYNIRMSARFDNILGRKTIRTLKMLTSEIKTIFCHSTMVDRIASMLNYLLIQLVGPNKKNLKVKDQKEYDFNPANLVLNICEIYINLSQSESFTLAVSQDGRSYSPDLFKLADNVLVRIGGVGILNELDQFAKNVEKAAYQKREEDEILNGAPEEFLDPIMSTLMTDPVILPSSRITIDRQTIARHLLSDQIDPFNRSPLTMDMVKSDTELNKKIKEWILLKKQERASSSQEP
ncbi:ubiquitin conjugation factor E4 A [Prorops nasuta]|uniref:ubiquitin conjugation factor E4 A n=1 Tax=Prorops nasuta TaxID=863751 RepID=UPI0034CD8779